MKTKIEEAVEKWSHKYREILTPQLTLVYNAEKKLLIKNMGCRRAELKWENKF